MATQETMEKFEKIKGKNLCLGITSDGEACHAISVPWDRTVTAMNMKLPNIYLKPEDLQDPEVLNRIGEYHVYSCYSFTPMKDYSFLEDWPDLYDLSLVGTGEAMDLSFLRQLKKWAMLDISHMNLECLDDVFPKDRVFEWGACFSVYKCQIKNIDAVCRENLRFNELIIYDSVQNPEEKKRWRKARANTYRYYYSIKKEEKKE